MPRVPPVAPAYRMLATLPRGPVIEMPFFYPAVGLFQHAKYMLASTSHWMPLVNGYSDFIPPDFRDHVMTLAPFPSRDAFKILEPGRVRYAVFHMNGYNTENRNEVHGRGWRQFDAATCGRSIMVRRTRRGCTKIVPRFYPAQHEVCFRQYKVGLRPLRL